MNNANRDTGRVVGAIVLIGLGVLFLFGQIFRINLWSVFDSIFALPWPFYIIIPGGVLLAIAVLGGRQAANMAIPGAVVTGTGLILLFQEMTDRYETWSYIWGLYPVFVGLALMYVGIRNNNPEQVSGGRRAVMVGIVLTAAFGLFMESIFSGTFDAIVEYAVPFALIAGGAFLLLRRGGRAVEPGGPTKPKNEDGHNGRPRTNPADVNPSLRRQIDEALAEDDPAEPRTTV